MDDEGEQPTAAELNAARQAHLAREHRLPQEKDMSYEEIDRFVKVCGIVQSWHLRRQASLACQCLNLLVWSYCTGGKSVQM